MITIGRPRTFGQKILAYGGVAALAVLLSASSCDGMGDTDKAVKSQQNAQMNETVDAFKQQRAAVPYPKTELQNSLERANLRDRLLRTNRPNAISYVYLLGDTGTYLGYYAIKGKVSSTQSQMTSAEFELDHGSYGQSVVQAPGDDGSYGSNEPGIFFFTTEGVMVTTDMRYIVSDAPLAVDVPKMNVPKQ